MHIRIKLILPYRTNSALSFQAKIDFICPFRYLVLIAEGRKLRLMVIHVFFIQTGKGS